MNNYEFIYGSWHLLEVVPFVFLLHSQIPPTANIKTTAQATDTPATIGSSHLEPFLLLLSVEFPSVTGGEAKGVPAGWTRIKIEARSLIIRDLIHNSILEKKKQYNSNCFDN